MIRKRMHEAVRKTGEQQVYQAVECAQAKTLGETACATCRSPQVYTQVIGMDDPISRAIPTQVEVLS